jgi:hypothetical protein
MRSGEQIRAALVAFVAKGFRTGILGEATAQALIQSLADTDARFPAAARTNLFEWARSRNPPLL